MTITTWPDTIHTKISTWFDTTYMTISACFDTTCKTTNTPSDTVCMTVSLWSDTLYTTSYVQNKHVFWHNRPMCENKHIAWHHIYYSKHVVSHHMCDKKTWSEIIRKVLIISTRCKLRRIWWRRQLVSLCLTFFYSFPFPPTVKSPNYL